MAGPYKGNLGSPVLIITDCQARLTHFTRQIIKLGKMDKKLLLISLCLLHLCIHCQGRPLRKRTVSEVQFMHNRGEHKQVQERREWLQMRLRGIHTAGARDGSGEAAGRRRRRRPLRLEELDELSDLTSEEIQQALNVLEELLSKETA